MKLLAVLAAVGFLAFVMLMAWRAPEAVPAESPSPSPTPTCTPTGTPQPCPEWLVERCLRDHGRALRVWREWRRAKRCLSETPRARLTRVPSKRADATVWRGARDLWNQEAKDFAQRIRKLVRRMETHRAGVLYLRPLIKWVWRCGDGLAYLMCHIAWHESGGRAYVSNTSSGAFGYFQLYPHPAGVWGIRSQVESALWKYEHGGLGHWCGCAAFTCSGGCGIY